MVKIIQAITYPDSFDVETLDENQSRQYIGKLGGIRRKNLSEQDVRDLNSCHMTGWTDNGVLALQRFWVMEQLLAFMKSPFPGCKIASSKHMSLYFGEVKDLQEQAADALYDLCEDLVQDVRLDLFSCYPPLPHNL